MCHFTFLEVESIIKIALQEIFKSIEQTKQWKKVNDVENFHIRVDFLDKFIYVL